ncbi:hypothetical protein HPB47_011173 [Ixodes persulcatus]|uniref:Uncharacterized protein n=1 Tax=Ixodes persulcatus TaxID=34615 RepID=A0AC60NXB1_IXOPE|nr:hypothetical protein HPB47_011173 [Ixodes persulcatus]
MCRFRHQEKMGGIELYCLEPYSSTDGLPRCSSEQLRRAEAPLPDASSRGSREKALGVVITYNGILSTAEQPPTRRPVITLSTLLDAAVKPACTSRSRRRGRAAAARTRVRTLQQLVVGCGKFGCAL